MSSDATPEYVRRLTLALDHGLFDLVGSGGVMQTSVAHDDKGRKRCAIYSGGPCNCDPEITISTPTGRFRILRNGRMVKSH